VDIYEYPYIMKLSQIRRHKIKHNLRNKLLKSFRNHWAAKVYYVVVGVSAFFLYVALGTWSGEVEDSIDSEFSGSLGGLIRLASMIGIGFGVFGLVTSFLDELEILFRQYQQKKQESVLDKRSVSGSSEDFLLKGDGYLRVNNFGKAHGAYSIAINRDPENWRAYIGRIDCFWLSQGFALDLRHLSYFVSFPITKPEETNLDGVRQLMDFAQRVVERKDIFINENGRIILDQSDPLRSHYITLHAPLPVELEQLISDCIQLKRNLPDDLSELEKYRAIRWNRVIGWKIPDWDKAYPFVRKFPWQDPYTMRPRERVFQDALQNFRFFLDDMVRDY
jgi:hypothetical protein